MTVYKYTVRDNKNEVAFLLDLQENINNENFSIKKTQDHYCSVDFEMFHKNQSLGFIELKCRYVSLKHFNTLIIGSTKLDNVQKYYPNTIFVWNDMINKELYFLPFTDDLLTYRNEICNGSYIKKIPKNLCKIGMTEFIDYIQSSFSTV